MAISYNLGSLLLGLAAWALACPGIYRPRTIPSAGWLPCLSFSCCAVSLLLQLYEIRRRIRIGDYSAVLDTIGGITFCAATLVIVTVILNLIGCLRTKRTK